MAFTFKSPTYFALCGAALLTLLASTAKSDAQIKVDDVKINVEIQKTPRFSSSEAKEKRDTQKQWIEVEVEFTADEKGGDQREEFIDELEFKYFITLTPKSGLERKVYTLTVTHMNIPKGDASASVAYMSPTSVAKIIGKDKSPNKSDVDVAVEIRHQGQLVGGDATKSAKSRWWNSMAAAEGMVLDKTQTPFAPLWWDRYAEVKRR